MALKDLDCDQQTVINSLLPMWFGLAAHDPNCRSTASSWILIRWNVQSVYALFNVSAVLILRLPVTVVLCFLWSQRVSHKVL